MAAFRPVQILLVEDSPDDVEIARRVFRRTAVVNELHIARDGQEALDFLFREGAYASSGTPDPDLVLLDLNLPKVNGLEVLARIRASERHAALPVIMLTSSEREEDIARSYSHGINTYIQKPVEFAKFTRAMEILTEYWTAIAKLPRRAA